MKLSFIFSVSLVVCLNLFPALQADALSDDLANAVKNAMTDPKLAKAENDDPVEGQVISCKKTDKSSNSHTNETKPSNNSQNERCK
ncbi:MAG: hypothetical protein ACWA5U_10195 [bacterium]